MENGTQHRSQRTIESFRQWNYQFAIDGHTTLDPVKHDKLLRRIANRKRLFMDPMIDAGYLAGKRVLDMGCNSGYWSLVCLREGKASFVRGIDAGPEFIEQANFVFEKYQIDRSSYEFRLDDIYGHLEADVDRYDVILCLGFFYHIVDPGRLLRLMAERCRGVIVVDTVVHNSPEALISVRPIGKRSVIDAANNALELVSSPKAIHWMADDVGLTQFRILRGEIEKVASMWDYILNERQAFALSSSECLDTIFPECYNPNFLRPQEDLKRYGYFPEMRRGGRAAMDPRQRRKGSVG